MDSKKENNRISFKGIWNIFMSLIYILVAYLAAFTPVLLPYSYKTGEEGHTDGFLIPRIILSFGFFAYGVFRIYQVIKYRR